MNIKSSAAQSSSMTRNEFREVLTESKVDKDVVALIPDGSEPVDSLIAGLDTESATPLRGIRGENLEGLGLALLATAGAGAFIATAGLNIQSGLVGLFAGSVLGYFAHQNISEAKKNAAQNQITLDARYISQLHQHLTDPESGDEMPERVKVGKFGQFLLRNQPVDPFVPVKRQTMNVADFVERMEKHAPPLADMSLNYFYPKDLTSPIEPWLKRWEQHASDIENGRGHHPNTTPWFMGTPTVRRDPKMRAGTIRKIRRWHEHMQRHPYDERAGWRTGAPRVSASVWKNDRSLVPQEPPEEPGRRILVD